MCIVFTSHGICQLACQQVESYVGITGDLSQPAGELVEHEASGDVGGVDCGFGGAGAGLGFGLGEEGGGVVLLGGGVGGGEDAEDFAAHAGVGPEEVAVLDSTPNGGAGGDGVDAAEEGFAGVEGGAVAVGDNGDCDVRIDLEDVGRSGTDFEMVNVSFPVPLSRDVGFVDGVEVDQLDVASAEGGELEGDLATDGTDADDGAGESSEFVVRDEVLLANKAGHGEGLWIGGMRGRGTRGASFRSDGGLDEVVCFGE